MRRVGVVVGQGSCCLLQAGTIGRGSRQASCGNGGGRGREGVREGKGEGNPLGRLRERQRRRKAAGALVIF